MKNSGNMVTPDHDKRKSQGQRLQKVSNSCVRANAEHRLTLYLLYAKVEYGEPATGIQRNILCFKMRKRHTTAYNVIQRPSSRDIASKTSLSFTSARLVGIDSWSRSRRYNQKSLWEQKKGENSTRIYWEMMFI